MATAFRHFHWGHVNNFHCATLKFSDKKSFEPGGYCQVVGFESLQGCKLSGYQH